MVFWLVPILVNMAIAFAISYAVGYFTKKTPDDIHYEPDTFDFPDIKEGKKFPIVFGTCWITDALLAWYGDIEVRKTAVRLSDTDGQYAYLNKYFYGAHHILCQGVCDGIIQVKVGDDVIWPAAGDKTSLNADGATSAVINLPELYGGIHEHNANITGSGGITGTVDFQYGQSSQALNDYLAAQQSSTASANRGLTAAILRKVYVGLSAQVKQWKYLVKRTDTTTTGDAIWYAAKSAIDTYSMNPAHILYECFTNAEWGLGISTDNIESESWEDAADTLYTEGFGLCIKWQGEQSLEEFIKDVLRYIDAVIYEDHSSGEMVMKLIRDDYTVASLDEYDENDIVSIDDYTRGTIHKVPDSTFVKYWNIYDNLPVVTKATDAALANSQNETYIINEEDYTAVIDAALAGQLAARQQLDLSAFAATMQIKCKRTMAALKAGDVFKLSYTPLGIVSMVVRVVTPHYGTLTDGIVTFDCIEDIFGMKDSIFGPPPETGWSIPDTTPEIYDNALTASVRTVASGPTVYNYTAAAPADSVGVTDFSAANIAYKIYVSDAVGLTDRVMADGFLIEEDVGVTDYAAVYITLDTNQNDSITLTDDVSAEIV